MALYLHLTKSLFCEPLCECEIRPVTKMTSIPCKRSLNTLTWKPKGRAGPRQTATHLQFCLVSIHQWGFHTARAVLSCTHLALKKRSVRSSKQPWQAAHGNPLPLSDAGRQFLPATRHCPLPWGPSPVSPSENGRVERVTISET